MRLQTLALALAITAAVQAASVLNAAGPDSGPALALTSARVSLDGTSNIHEFTASTNAVRLVAVTLLNAAADPLDEALRPGGLTTFEVAIPAVGLASSKEDLDKNMHKALKVKEHKDITFRLRTLEKTPEAYRALGWLTIAGVEKEVTLNLQVERKGAALAITGGTELLMTDYGITPPKAMLGMLKTNPKVVIRIELLLSSPLTTT